MNEDDALLILNGIPGLGNAKIRGLREYFGSARAILSLRSPEDLSATGSVTAKIANRIMHFPQTQFLESERRLIERNHVSLITDEDPEYPDILKEIPDAPIVLMVKGIFPEFLRSLAIVGSRRASCYGMTMATNFARELGEKGFTIVSGLARGIDTCAHEGALLSRAATLGVLGSGLGQIYPSENKDLSEKISQNGGVISEFPMNTPPLSQNFPRRNRIISGLSLGVLVIEASEKSGALITADFALEQGREVFALPGPVESPTTKGVHRLIQQGAKLVTCVEDILEELPLAKISKVVPRVKKHLAPSGRKPEPGLLPEEEAVLGVLSSTPLHIDGIAQLSPLDRTRLSTTILSLELKQLIKQLPGKFYVKSSHWN